MSKLLTKEEIVEIRSSGRMDTKNLAAEYDVSYQYINDIIHYRVETDLDPVAAERAMNTMPLRTVRKRKLTDHQALDIMTSNLTYRVLAEKYNCAASYVKLVAERKIYKDVAILENAE